MGRSWDDFENTSGPLDLILKGFGVLLVAGLVIGGTMWTLGWFTETAAVVKQEFGPRRSLEKYEWFKDAAAALDKKRADLQVYEARLADLNKAYVGKDRTQWAREDREQSSIWQSESAGIRASYNQLAADYNSQMAKFNWAYANAGRQPDGSLEPLPREFRPYDMGGAQ